MPVVQGNYSACALRWCQASQQDGQAPGQRWWPGPGTFRPTSLWATSDDPGHTH